MMRLILRLVPLALGLAGALLLAAVVWPDLASAGLWNMRITHAALAGIGLGLIASGFWAYRWVSGGLTWRDAPVALLTIIVVVVSPLPVLLLGKQADLQRQVYALGDRLFDMEVRVARPARTSWECAPVDPLREPRVAWREVVSGLNKPVGLTHAGDGSGRLFVTEKGGTIRIIRNGELLARPFLDIRERVLSDDTDLPASWEQGLLGLAFAPDYEESGRLFLAYSAVPDGRTVIAEYRVSEDPDVARPDDPGLILEIPQPGWNHNGGQLLFGPDGFLYFGAGDGGFDGEPHGDDPDQLAQRLDNLLGKILRIDVSDGQGYTIPADNPFARHSGARPEIYAYGLRNPWRFSFDRCDGALFAGDVGRTSWEEVNLVHAGGNYGWPIMEGPGCFWRNRQCRREGLTLPVIEYPHHYRDPDGGGSVIGGYVYRGAQFPQLHGYYFLADFIGGHLFSLAHQPASPGHWVLRELARTGFPVSSFGEDEERELYMVGYQGAIFQLIAAD
jgi:glucose/arabinose dehydrogenase